MKGGKRIKKKKKKDGKVKIFNIKGLKKKKKDGKGKIFYIYKRRRRKRRKRSYLQLRVGDPSKMVDMQT